MTPCTARMIIEGIPIVESTSAFGAELRRLRRIMRTASSNKRKEATYAVPVDRFPVPLPKP